MCVRNKKKMRTTVITENPYWHENISSSKPNMTTKFFCSCIFKVTFWWHPSVYNTFSKFLIWLVWLVCSHCYALFLRMSWVSSVKQYLYVVFSLVNIKAILGQQRFGRRVRQGEFWEEEGQSQKALPEVAENTKYAWGQVKPGATYRFIKIGCFKCNS